MRLWRRSVAVLLALFALAAALPASAQEMRSYTDDAGRTVDVPVAPKRIVSLHDSSLTVPLLELGVMPVGSFGRPGADGKVYMRGAATLSLTSSEIRSTRHRPRRSRGRSQEPRWIQRRAEQTLQPKPAARGRRDCQR